MSEPDNVTTAPPSPELAALRVEAVADNAPPADAAAAAVAPGAPAANPQTETVEEFRDALDYTLDEWVIPERPQLAAVYTAERRARLAQATHALFVKRGWSLAGLWVEWKEEIAFAMVALPLLRDTRKALMAPKPASGAAVDAPGAAGRAGGTGGAPVADALQANKGAP